VIARVIVLTLALGVPVHAQDRVLWLGAADTDELTVQLSTNGLDLAVRGAPAGATRIERAASALAAAREERASAAAWLDNDALCVVRAAGVELACTSGAPPSARALALLLVDILQDAPVPPPVAQRLDAPVLSAPEPVVTDPEPPREEGPRLGRFHVEASAIGSLVHRLGAALHLELGGGFYAGVPVRMLINWIDTAPAFLSGGLVGWIDEGSAIAFGAALEGGGFAYGAGYDNAGTPARRVFGGWYAGGSISLMVRGDPGVYWGARLEAAAFEAVGAQKTVLPFVGVALFGRFSV
jgi:hypothetical protein